MKSQISDIASHIKTQNDLGVVLNRETRRKMAKEALQAHKAQTKALTPKEV